MIADTLTFLVSKLNAYLDDKLGHVTDARVKLGNVARALDGSLTNENSLLDKVIVTLVNIEQERAVQPGLVAVKTATSVMYKSPPVLLNLYVLVSVHKDQYEQSLILLSYVVQFFQFNHHFVRLDLPEPLRGLESLTAELYTMNFEQVNHLWSTLGGKYLPCVLYKVRHLLIDEDTISSEGPLITETAVNPRFKGPTI